MFLALSVYRDLCMLILLGVVASTAIALGLLALIWRIAQRERLLAPVVVAFGLRLGLTVGLHIVSVATGHGGFFYLDDHGYAMAGSHLAHLWLQGHPGDVFGPLGILPNGGPLFYQTVAGVFVLTDNSVLAMKIVNVLLGTGTVLGAGILANRLLGPRRGRWSAWVVAVAPTIVWWTLPMLREPLATFFAAATLAAATGIPRWRNVLLTLVFVSALAFSRSTLFVAVAIAIVGWCFVVVVRASAARAGPAHSIAQRLAVLGITVLVVAAVGLQMGGGSSTTLAGAASVSVKESRHMASAGSSSSSSDNAAEDFQSPLVNGIAGFGVATYAGAAVRFFMSPRAWAFTTVPLDWYQPLYPAMWLWYMAIPIAVFGLWRMRRRLDVLALVALPILFLAVEYTFALNSGVRQRSGVEPLIALLIVSGWVSWAVSLRWASIVLTVLTPIAVIDARSPWPAVGLLPAAVLLYLLSRRLAQREAAAPAEPNRPGPQIPAEAPLERV